MAARFEVLKDAGGWFRWRLKAETGEVIALGEACPSKDAALSGIESVRISAAGAEMHDRT